MENYKLSGVKKAALRQIYTEQKLSALKTTILNAMVDYYGEENRSALDKVIKSIPIHEYKNEIEAEDIRELEGYNDALIANNCYYTWLGNQKGKVGIKQFIILDNRKYEKKSKKIYDLIESYVKAFMSNNLAQGLTNYQRYSGNVLLTYSHSSDNMSFYKPDDAELRFEKACIKCDAIMIINNYLGVNIYKKSIPADRDVDRIMPLFENENTRKIIDDARINHIGYDKLEDDTFAKVQFIVDQVIPNLENVSNDSNVIDQQDENLNKLLTEYIKNNYTNNNTKKN